MGMAEPQAGVSPPRRSPPGTVLPGTSTSIKYQIYDDFFFFFFRTLSLSSFWTSRGHRCRPFFPPVLAFNFYRA